MAAYTANYCLYVGTLTFLAALGGLIAHFIRASIGHDETPIHERGFLVIGGGEDRYFEKNIIRAHRNDDGSWDGHSVRNMTYLASAAVLVVLVPCLLAWSIRQDVLLQACANFALFNLKPMFCY